MHQLKNVKMGCGGTDAGKNKKGQNAELNAATVDVYMAMYLELLKLQLEMLEIKEQVVRYFLEMSQAPSKEQLKELQQERQGLHDRLEEVLFQIEVIRDELDLI